MRYFDLHCDTASVCYKRGISPNNVSLAVSLQKGGVFEKWIQCFAVFIPDGCEDPVSEYRSQIADFRGKILDSAIVKPVFTLENATPICSEESVDMLANDGIKAVTLTWNSRNRIAGGVDSESGMTDFGFEVIKWLNKKRIAVDLSHLNRKSFLQVEKAAESVFASHVCCYKTHRHKRNLTDEQLKIIAGRGGVIGVCFYPDFLGTKYALEGVWRHVFHLLNIGLENSIAIGSDFDGAVMSGELDGVDKIPELSAFLLKKGLSQPLLDKIFFENANKYFTML